jgi:hypothetical protein
MCVPLQGCPTSECRLTCVRMQWVHLTNCALCTLLAVSYGDEGLALFTLTVSSPRMDYIDYLITYAKSENWIQFNTAQFVCVFGVKNCFVVLILYSTMEEMSTYTRIPCEGNWRKAECENNRWHLLINYVAVSKHVMGQGIRQSGNLCSADGFYKTSCI